MRFECPAAYFDIHHFDPSFLQALKQFQQGISDPVGLKLFRPFLGFDLNYSALPHLFSQFRRTAQKDEFSAV